MAYHGVNIPEEQIKKICRKYHISRLSLFGSILRDDFAPDSDVDMLVEFEKGYKPGLLGMVRLEMELSEILGRKVDLRTPAELSRHFRDEVLREAEEQFVSS